MLFFFNDTATTEIYTLSLHDALPRSPREPLCPLLSQDPWDFWRWHPSSGPTNPPSTRRRFRKGPERPAAWRPLDTFQRASVYLPPPTGRNSPGIRLAPGCPTDSARLPDPRARHQALEAIFAISTKRSTIISTLYFSRAIRST